jgi:hypothetical protein
MVKGERKSSAGAGELLYLERIPKKLQPRKVLAGKRWAYFERIGRVIALALVIYVVYQLLFTDLSGAQAFGNVLLEIIVAALMVYVTEVISPRGRRMSIPIEIYSKGLLVFTSTLETFRGKPSWIPKEKIAKLLVRRLTINHEGKNVVMPTNLKLVLTNGKVLDLGRRNYNELYNIVKVLEEKYGVLEQSVP